MSITATDITVRFGQRTVLSAINIAVPAGQWLALVGRNGCGKTTLLRVLAGLTTPTDGMVTLNGKTLLSLSRREIARQIAVLSQAMPVIPGLTVRQLVRQGRYAARGPLGMLSATDDRHVRRALVDTAVLDYAEAPIDQLSGGERQRARLALALAQNAPILLLDEPTTYLDVRHQLETLELIARLRNERNLTVVTVLHDLVQAARFADRVIALQHGHIYTDGPASDVITTELLAEVFGIQGRVWRDTYTNRPACSYDAVLSEAFSEHS